MFLLIIKFKLLKIFLAIVIKLEIVLIQKNVIKIYLTNAFSQNKQLIYKKIC